MLKDTLFKIISSEHRENVIHVNLEMNKDSEIFEGHFPGHPVLPGACMLQILKEVLEGELNIPFRLKRADHIKFLSLIVPENNTNIQLNLSYSSENNKDVYVTASLTAQKHICFKFRGAFAAM